MSSQSISLSELSSSSMEVIIDRDRSTPMRDLVEIWMYRDLLWTLALRDVQVRYKQTLLGVAWVVLQPLAMTGIFTALVGWWMGLADKTQGLSYSLFVFAGLLPWTFFSASTQAATSSLVNNSNMLRKVYFPRLIVPLASLGAPLVDLLVCMLVLLLVAPIFGAHFSFWLLPLLVMGVTLTLLSTAGLGLAMSALTVRYRDFRYITQFLLQAWFYVTPIVYPASIVPGKWRYLMMFNPVAGPIEAMRSALTGQSPDWLGLGVSACGALFCLIFGLILFQRGQRRVADLI